MVAALLVLLAAQTKNFKGEIVPNPVPPKIGEYTLYFTYNAKYTYFGVLVIKNKTVYGFKSHPKNPIATGTYVYKGGKAQFLTGPYKGQAALFTIEKGVYGVEMDVRTKKNPRGSLLLGTIDGPKKRS